MIRNRYNYLSLSVQDTKGGKKNALKATTAQLKHYKQKTKMTVSFPIIGQTAIQNKKKSRAPEHSTDSSKAVVPVLVLLFVALWFILRGDLF